MKIRIIELLISCKKAQEVITFADFNYFYGQMGAGKSTIARLIDFCLGGDLEMTPALQSEFVSVALSLKVESSDLFLSRNANTTQLRARWFRVAEEVEVLIPARNPAHEVLPGTGIEVLSDLLFFLAGIHPPKVRRSKTKEESELERLSMRDLFWYCYLDQESIDSSFFDLDADAHPFRRLKSRDVLRFLIGFHQEKVAELETQLELVRERRLRAEAGVSSIREVLSSAELASGDEIGEARGKLELELENAQREIDAVRNKTSNLRTHGMDQVREKAKVLAEKLQELQQALVEIQQVLSEDKAHKNELLSLATRFRRSRSARAVLGGVEFNNCPRCGQPLPTGTQYDCLLCGQHETDTNPSTLDDQAAENDLAARVDELTDLISRHEASLLRLGREIKEVSDEKSIVDSELTRISTEYDSAYLSLALETEKRRSALFQQLLDLKQLEVLVQKIADLQTRVYELTGEEQKLRSELKDARAKAERDTQNLTRLKELFLDCLLRSKIPGFLASDIVQMRSPHFLPEVVSADSGDLAVTSFANLGSGGKKTLFKCCFAVAVHRLVTEIGATLPTLLIIDSPMKNISERENREQFEGFHQMLYALSRSELRGHQFIMIDKELCSPPSDMEIDFTARHMRPDDDKDPPLIRYYRGK